MSKHTDKVEALDCYAACMCKYSLLRILSVIKTSTLYEIFLCLKFIFILNHFRMTWIVNFFVGADILQTAKRVRFIYLFLTSPSEVIIFSSHRADFSLSPHPPYF